MCLWSVVMAESTCFPSSPSLSALLSTDDVRGGRKKTQSSVLLRNIHLAWIKKHQLVRMETLKQRCPLEGSVLIQQGSAGEVLRRQIISDFRLYIYRCYVMLLERCRIKVLLFVKWMFCLRLCKMFEVYTLFCFRTNSITRLVSHGIALSSAIKHLSFCQKGATKTGAGPGWTLVPHLLVGVSWKGLKVATFLLDW